MEAAIQDISHARRGEEGSHEEGNRELENFLRERIAPVSVDKPFTPEPYLWQSNAVLKRLKQMNLILTCTTKGTRKKLGIASIEDFDDRIFRAQVSLGGLKYSKQWAEDRYAVEVDSIGFGLYGHHIELKTSRAMDHGK